MQGVIVRRALLLGTVVLLLAAFVLATSAHARADGSGTCDPTHETCTVDTAGGGGGGGSGGGDDDGGSNPCAATPNASYGSKPPAVTQACADALQGRYCNAILADALGGLEVRNTAALTPAQVTALNAGLATDGCPLIITAASLAQEAFKTIVFPRPSGHRSPSETQFYRGFPMTWVNLWTFYWTDPGTWHTLSASASAAGLTATVTATPVALNFDPGDGSGPQGCAGPGRPWTTADGSSPPSSGACAYRYARVTTAPITATETIVWKITWAGTGNTGGEIPGLSTSTSGQLNVLQIQAVDR